MLKTEARNPHTIHIDTMTTAEMTAVMQQENINAAQAVGAVLPAIGEAIDRIALRMQEGGRLFYIGCGTSGRLGVLDASECPPTYGIPADRVVGIIAGGDGALRRAVEGAEDDSAAGKRDLGSYAVTSLDTVVGLSVAGNAGYVVGALELAQEAGALTVAIACNEDCRINRIADIAITPDTGAEVITGSSRMKAGSAQKMILNMLSTGVMIRCGRVYQNYMIYIRPVNAKLRSRMIRMVSDIADVDASEAEARLEASGWDIRTAVEEGASHGREQA